MRLGPFVQRIHEQRGVPLETLREEMLAAARKTATEVLGPEPRIEAVWSADGQSVELRQVVTAVERVTRPYRELAVADLRALGEDFAGLEAGEEMELSVLFHDEDAAQAGGLDAQLGGLLALSCFQRSLRGPLDEAWTAAVQRHLPPREWPDGTAAALFQRGGWLVGSTASADGVTLSIANGIWKERPLTPDDAVFHVGFGLRIERWGRALDLPMELPRVLLLAEVSRWAATPAPDSRRAAVEADLAWALTRLAGESSLDRLEGPVLVARVLASVLEGGG